MRVIYNNTEKDITILKHFRVMDDEFILYNNLGNVSIGQIIQNRIMVPNLERVNILMQVLGNLLSGIPDSNVILLPNEMKIQLEEIGYQNVNLTQDQFNYLINNNVNDNSVENSLNSIKRPHLKKGVKIAFLSILVILSLVALGFALKKPIAALFSKTSQTSSTGGKVVKKIEGVEIIKGLKTYAARKTFGTNGKVYEYYDLIVRYDQDGNLKYYEYTDNIVLDELEETKNKSDKEIKKLVEEEAKESKIPNLNYIGFKVIMEVNNRIYRAGYAFTDESVAAGILNSKPEEQTLVRMINDYEEVKTESLVKETFEKAKDSINKANGEFLIINDKKVE